jgi:short-subunit dehydrogenase
MALPAPHPERTALVTGASSGIGAAIARQLARRGHGLTLVARRAPLLEALADELRAEHDVKVDVIPCDLGVATSRWDLLGTLADSGREVSILVNNAGFATGGRFVDTDVAREVEQVRVLVEAVVHLTAATLPGMVERREGAILNIASTAGFQPLPWSAGYSSAKAHTLAFSESLHEEVRGRGVAVTALCPGPVRTEFWEVAAGQPIKQAMPRPMWVSVENVAEAGIRGLERGRRVVVPGRAVQLSSFGARWTPHAIQLPMLRRAMNPR